MQRIYLDNNASTVIEPAVAEAMHQCHREGFVNPASQHQSGQKARRRLETLRSELLEMLGAKSTGMDADQLVFTSGGTESNNLALTGLAYLADGSLPDNKRLLISSIEHPSIDACATYLASLGFTIERLSVNADGVVQVDELEQLLRQPTRLVSVMSANNETGVIQPVAEIAQICRQHGALFHTDAVQVVGKLPVNFTAIDADALSFTAHKMHGPRGIGGLVLRNGVSPFPMLFGGFQQLGVRPGTEDVALVTGFTEAFRLFIRDIDRAERMEQLRDRLLKLIAGQLDDPAGVIVNGQHSLRVPHTLNLSFPGVNRQEFIMAADMQGLSVSTGSACASGSSDPSPILIAMGLEQEVIEGSIRISLSAQTTESEIDLAAERIVLIVNNLRRQKSR